VAAGWLLSGRTGADSGPGGTGEATITVLPLSNLSPDEDNAYFADGIHDEILTQLAKIAAPHVISRTSVLEYRGTTKNVRTIADELGVRHILEGTVRRAGDRVRITTRLINARSDEHLWAETYVREYSVSSVFNIQSEIAREIAGALEATLSPEEEARVSRLDSAIAILEKLVSIPSPWSLATLRADPAWDPLRDHPRSQALLEEYG